MTPGPSICARRRKGVARNHVPVVVRHGLSPPVPLCRSPQSVARNRPIRAEGASRHRASNPFAAELPNTWGIFVQNPLMACPRRSSCIPLMQIPRDVARNTRSVPRLHTPSNGSLSATSAPIPAGVVGSVRVIARPSGRSLCSAETIYPETLATVRPEARRVPTGHLAPKARTSPRDAVRTSVLPISARARKSVAPIPQFCRRESWPAPLPLCRSLRSVARDRPVCPRYTVPP